MIIFQDRLIEKQHRVIFADFLSYEYAKNVSKSESRSVLKHTSLRIRIIGLSIQLLLVVNLGLIHAGIP